VNGALVGGENVTRGVGVDTNRYRVAMPKGRSLLLLKIVQGGGPTGWSLRLSDQDGNGLKECTVWLCDK
jgi:hypothetical protein